MQDVNKHFNVRSYFCARKVKRMSSNKILSLSALAFILMVSACRKNYTCTCSTTIGTSGVESSKIRYELKKQYREDAEDFCERYEEDLNRYSDTSTTGCAI